MGKKNFLLFCFLLPVLLTGCLPGGAPPEGKIVDNPLTLQPMTLAKARELAITSLGAWSLSQAQGAAVRIGDRSLAEISFAAEVIRGAGELSGIYAAPSGPYLLTVRISSGTCALYLTGPAQKIFWQEKYPLSKSSEK